MTKSELIGLSHNLASWGSEYNAFIQEMNSNRKRDARNRQSLVTIFKAGMQQRIGWNSYITEGIPVFERLLSPRHKEPIISVGPCRRTITALNYHSLVTNAFHDLLRSIWLFVSCHGLIPESNLKNLREPEIAGVHPDDHYKLDLDWCDGHWLREEDSEWSIQDLAVKTWTPVNQDLLRIWIEKERQVLEREFDDVCPSLLPAVITTQQVPRVTRTFLKKSICLQFGKLGIAERT